MQDDPLINAVYLGIKAGISRLFEAELFGPALVLLYTGIDTMAWLDMPSGQASVTRGDFIRWVETHFGKDFTSKVTGEELYSARCAVVHTYTVESNMTRTGTRMIGYKLGGSPPVNFNPNIDPRLLIIDLGYLRDQFFSAVDNFLMKAFVTSSKGALIDQRAQKLLSQIPWSKLTKVTDPPIP